MANANLVVLVGNLTRDPELKTLPSGTSVCDMRIAVNDRFKDSDGEWKERPFYFNVNVWGKQGESCAQYLSKGRSVYVQGRLTWREWEAQDGTKRQAVDISADRVQFLGPRDGDGGGSSSGSREDFSPPAERQGGDDFVPAAGGSSDDDIPF